jgi:pilus assembly protein Flp/PilA
METIMDQLKRLLRDESGATSIEYSVIATGISIGIIVAVTTIGTQLKATFVNITSQLATTAK